MNAKGYNVKVILTSENGNRFLAAWHTPASDEGVDALLEEGKGVRSYTDAYPLAQHFSRLILRSLERGDSLDSSRPAETLD